MYKPLGGRAWGQKNLNLLRTRKKEKQVYYVSEARSTKNIKFVGRKAAKERKKKSYTVA